MTKHNSIVIIGGSAGSLSLISAILQSMPADIPFAILIVHHISSESSGYYIDVWNEKSKISVREICSGMIISNSCAYVVPPDYHVLIEEDYSLTLTIDERINFARPSIDYAIQSVIDVYKKNTIGVLLSGSNYDGAQGMRKIHQIGGKTLVQSPKDAEFPEMPQAAINLFKPDFILPICEIVNQLLFLVNTKNK